MEITKFGHACFVATRNNQSVVVDPGELSPDFVDPGNVVAVVVTHIHGDHLDRAKLAATLARNPSAVLLAHQEVVESCPDIAVTAVAAGDIMTAGEFRLRFTGGDHALVHPGTPMCANLGVMIDEEVYYPGDSFTEPGAPVKTLALPIAAPWMKTSEGMDFLTKLKPERAFPTHDAVLSEDGKDSVESWMKMAAEKAGAKYNRL